MEVDEVNWQDVADKVKQLKVDYHNECDARVAIYRLLPNIHNIYKDGNADVRCLVSAIIDAKIDDHHPGKFLNKSYRKQYNHLKEILEDIQW